MTGRFEMFAIIAGMRTGSNLLEERLATHPQITCHGELFNPHFVGVPGQDGALGITRADRDADPTVLLNAVRADPSGIAGFRIFDGHDEGALEAVLADPRCAKIVLTRDPLDSFLSLKIARKTGQWWLGDLGSARVGKVRFDPAEFGGFLEAVGRFRHRIRRSLQDTGQAAFQIDYADLQTPEVISGLHAFLGCDPVRFPARTRTKAQNPKPATEKVTNPKVMTAALARMSPFDPDHGPDLEPPRGAGVPGYRVAAGAAVLFAPVGRVVCDEVDQWLTRISNGRPPRSGLNQKELRAWMRASPGHRRFAVVAHPASRIHDAFCAAILPAENPDLAEIRHLLVRHYGVPLPDDPNDPGFDLEAHRAAFLAFLRFVRGNLGGQTGLRPHPVWASQSAILAGISTFAVPDAVLRAEALEAGLDRLAAELGLAPAPFAPPPVKTAPFRLDQVLDDEGADLIRSAYRRDFMQLGYALC
jgi:hypothetical protein